MNSSIVSSLSSLLFRVLELEPRLGSEEAVRRTIEAVQGSSLLTNDVELLGSTCRAITSEYRHCGVINPAWLKRHGVGFHCFLVNARPGWLENLVAQSGRVRKGISQYILYGDYDSLIILCGTEAEAEAQQQLIENDLYLSAVAFSARSVPLIYRYPIKPVSAHEPKVDDLNALSALIENYDDGRDRTTEMLLNSGVLLGPVWLTRTHSRERVTAFVGMALHGRHEVRPVEMLAALQRDEHVGRSLVHLFETDSAKPYDYFAKVVCVDQEELDKVTDSIGSLRLGHIWVESTTMVVANGSDQPPLLRVGEPDLAGELPSLSKVEAAARDMVITVGPEAGRTFNQFELETQLLTLASLATLDRRLKEFGDVETWTKRLLQAADLFRRATLAENDTSLEGAMTVLAATVEAAAQRAVRLLVELGFQTDYGAAQKELGLATVKFQKLTLGRARQALQNIREHAYYARQKEQLAEDKLALLGSFAERRNEWLHGAKAGLERHRRLVDAAAFMENGVEVLGWLVRDVMPVIEPRELSLRSKSEDANAPRTLVLRTEPQKKYRVFVSHSASDIVVARKVAAALEPFFNVFFSDWSIEPSQSIVDKIEHALANSDTLLVMLSPASVKSRWVKKELDSTMMRQLSGQDITVLPVLIADCDIPEILREIKYVDCRADFDEGLLKLIQFLKRRRDRQNVI